MQSAWAKRFEFQNLDSESIEKDKMEIRVTSLKTDKYNKWILCQDNKSLTDYSIVNMVIEDKK